MSFPIFRVWIALGCCAAANAQAPPALSGTIAGMVVDGGNNAPIRRVVVTLSTVEARPRDAVAWTDANGRFAFGYLPPGRYELRVSKNGYQAAIYGAASPRRPPGTIELASGETRGDIVFRLQLMTSITGTVVDEQGNPLEGVSINTMQWGRRRGKRRLLPGASAMSDAAGHYRITGIAPGAYTLAASQFGRALAPTSSEAVPGPPQRPYSYGLQYYPGTDRAESAALLSVEAGHEYSQIDFHLTARPSPSVRGKIVPPPGVGMLEQVSINAVAQDSNGGGFGVGVSQPDFEFLFAQLQPGSYTFVAQAAAGGKRYWGKQSVEVTAQDVSDLSVVLQPSAELAGTVIVEGPDAAKYPPSSVTLAPGDDTRLNGPQPRATVNKDGTFKFSELPPGVWDINPAPLPPGGYIKSMRLGNQDVLTEEMVIDSSTQASLKIVFGTRAAHISGDVSLNGQPARGVVMLAPEPRFRHVLSFYRTVTADASGHFEIRNASPGAYQLFAFEELDPQSIQDPEFLKPFESAGRTVTLREGDNPPQKLSFISASTPSARPGIGDVQ